MFNHPTGIEILSHCFDCKLLRIVERVLECCLSTTLILILDQEKLSSRIEELRTRRRMELTEVSERTTICKRIYRLYWILHGEGLVIKK